MRLPIARDSVGSKPSLSGASVDKTALCPICPQRHGLWQGFTSIACDQWRIEERNQRSKKMTIDGFELEKKVFGLTVALPRSK